MQARFLGLRSAASFSVFLGLVFSSVGAGQPGAATPPKPAPPTVYSNPRAGADDPRIGLKGGLYDAGEAAFGMQRIATLPKPPGFAPGSDATATTPPPEPPAEPGVPAAGGRGGRGMGVQYGSTNSDLAFSGNHLFVGNYNGINFYDIDNPG